MKYLRLFLCVIVSALVFSPQPGMTDITPMDYNASPTGGGVSPKSPHPTIRLDDQEVLIRLKPATYAVDAVFHLSNTGETTTEWIGFPKNVTGRLPGPLGRVMDFIRFDVSVNEKNVPFTEERDLIKAAQRVLKRSHPRPEQHAGWLMGQATFPGHAITTIRVKYEAHYDNCGFTCSQAVYIYGTGGYWKDRIGRASFIVDSSLRGGSATAIESFSPSETEKYMILRKPISEDIQKYDIKDFEPNPDSALTIRLVSRRTGNDRGINALVPSAMNGRLEEVQALLRKGVDVNAKSGFGETPLMAAAGGGFLQVAKLLLENGADVNAQTKDGKTALANALARSWMGRGQLEVARFLRDHGAKSTTLAVAAFVGDMEAVRRFTAEGVHANAENDLGDPAPLTAAAMGGQTDVVNLLLDKGLHVDAKNEQGQTALMAAASAGHAEVVKTLLNRGADINAKDAHRSGALRDAAERGHVEAARALLDRGADMNARDDPADRTILMDAAQSGRLEVVKLLLEKGANVNARDMNGDTALSLAAGKDVEEIEQLLKAHGAKK